MIVLLETVLASWRLAHMLVNEDGPFAVFAKLRYRAGIRKVPAQGANGVEVITVAPSTIAQGLTCVWCVSVWSALLFACPLRVVTGLRRVLAVSAGAIVVHEAIERLRGRG